MRQNFFLLSVVAFAITNCYAADKADTTIIVKNPKQVILKEDSRRVKIQMGGTEQDASFRFERSWELKDSGVVITRERVDWDFLPFIPTKRSSSIALKYHAPLFNVGFSTATVAPSGMSTPFGSSWEFMFTPIKMRGPLLAKNFGCFVGFGFAWRNYRMTGYQRYMKENNKVIIGDYPEGADIDFSRIKTFCMTVPLLLEWQVPLNGDFRFWWNAGPIVNFNTYASMKTRYKIDGRKIKDFDKHIHQQPVTLDLYTSIGINNLGLYVRYSPCHVLKEDFAPAFTSFSMGVTTTF